MRKKILGAFAALSAAAGGALAQSPTRPVAPTPIGTVGSYDGGMKDPMVRPANAERYNEPVPPPMPGMGMGMDPGMGADPMMGMGGPMYPPPGPYGQMPYEQPVLGEGAFSATSPHRFYLDGQYLLLFPESQPTRIPLLTTSAPADFGRLGSATTTILAGDRNSLNLGTVSGFRINGGFMRAGDQRVGIEVGGLYQSPTSYTHYAQSSAQGIPVIARPFTNAVNGAAQSLVVSSPNSISGSALVRATTEFWGIEASGVLNLFRTCPGDCRLWQLNLLGGYRYLELNETLGLSSQSAILAGTLPAVGLAVGPPTSIAVRDQFSAINRFHGAQVGLQSQFTSGRWYVGMTGKVAFGGVNQRLEVAGSTALANPVAQTGSVTLGGLFANASNIGRYRTDQFAIVTDLNATLGFHLTTWLIGTVGYNFIHLSTAVRPGNQFDGRVDPSLVPTSGAFGTAPPAGRPPINIRQDDFFTHGLNFGFILKY
ncbi:MAG: BBP7 family outer membrane beta-barrel protein [Fimbriiglobus sp.]|nr:BBP7 family outer membrane beta-barrel protein [Fimbriiglobus sp.]